MRDIPILKGDTTVAKFQNLEILLRRMNRRLSHTITSVTPPSPIFHYVECPEADGTIIKGLLPAGVISMICVSVSKYNTKKAVTFRCEIEDENGNGNSYNFQTHKKIVKHDSNLSIPKTSFFHIKVIGEDVQNLIEGIWLTVLFQFDRKISDIKTYLIDEIDRVSNEGI